MTRMRRKLRKESWQHPFAAVDPQLRLSNAWDEILGSSPSHSTALSTLYEVNAACFDIHALNTLLGITRTRTLSVALRTAGLRKSYGGPIVGFGEIRQARRSFAPYDLWTIHGAVAAWHVARERKLSIVTARRLGEALLAASGQVHLNNDPTAVA